MSFLQTLIKAHWTVGLFFQINLPHHKTQYSLILLITSNKFYFIHLWKHSTWKEYSFNHETNNTLHKKSVNWTKQNLFELLLEEKTYLSDMFTKTVRICYCLKRLTQESKVYSPLFYFLAREAASKLFREFSEYLQLYKSSAI